MRSRKPEGVDVADTSVVCAHAPASPGAALGTTVERRDRDAMRRGRVLKEAARPVLVVAEAETRSTTRPRAVDAPQGTACERRTAEAPARSRPRPRRTPPAVVTTAPRGAPRVRAYMGAKPVASGFRRREYSLRVAPRRPNARGAECGPHVSRGMGRRETHQERAQPRYFWSFRTSRSFPSWRAFQRFSCCFLRHLVDRYSSVKTLIGFHRSTRIFAITRSNFPGNPGSLLHLSLRLRPRVAFGTRRGGAGLGRVLCRSSPAWSSQSRTSPGLGSCSTSWTRTGAVP